jgi:hypothetical protein
MEHAFLFLNEFSEFLVIHISEVFYIPTFTFPFWTNNATKVLRTNNAQFRENKIKRFYETNSFCSQTTYLCLITAAGNEPNLSNFLKSSKSYVKS